VEDYEAQLAPLYAWLHAMAQRAPGGERPAPAGGGSLAVWRMLQGGRRAPLRARALAALFPVAVRAVNRAGLGPVHADVSAAGMRRGALHGIGEALRRLRVGAPHAIFGHSHRTGMLPGDDPAEWRTAAGTRLHNTGSWVFERHFMGAAPPGESPYWPGGAIAVGEDGPPRLERLLSAVPAGALAGG
jgi:hypothetical protein